MKVNRPIYTFDIETDPFENGADIQPFTCGLYAPNVGTGKVVIARKYTFNNGFIYTWGKDCIKKMKLILDVLPSGIVYAHNGGKFDFYWCQDWFSELTPMTIINGRIVRASIWKPNGETHEARDSLAIIPIALKKYKKDTVDYRTFTKQYRLKHKREILAYLEDDCKYLHEMVMKFLNMFGDNLTIGSTSMKQLKKLHKFDTLDAVQDKRIRSSYYYGGRVQCFEGGELVPSKGKQFVLYDLNQCYPHVMRNMKHPVSIPREITGNEITTNTYFVTAYGRNHNAFPLRTEDGLTFKHERGIFSVSIHEYNAAIDTGMFECEDIIETLDFERAASFDAFVDKFHTLRADAQEKAKVAVTDNERVTYKLDAEFYKYVGNSAYGKFAQSPDNYYDYMLADDTNAAIPQGFYMWLILDFAGKVMWRRESTNQSRYNVATGASITGGARSLLIRALAKAKRPLYCDTDSLVCEQLNGVPIHERALGHWKVERTANRMAIAGRKTYAMFADTCPSCNGTRTEYRNQCVDVTTRDDLFHTYGCVKKACKGVILEPHDILRVARGEVITWRKESPTFDMIRHESRYLHREVKRTV